MEKADWRTPPAQCKTISLVGISPAGARAMAEQAGVAACDRARIVSSRREPDGSSSMQLGKPRKQSSLDG